jgi:hypothetical protein
MHAEHMLALPSIGMLLGRRLVNPVPLAVIMSMQPALIVPSEERFLHVLRRLFDGFTGKIDEHF